MISINFVVFLLCLSFSLAFFSILLLLNIQTITNVSLLYIILAYSKALSVSNMVKLLSYNPLIGVFSWILYWSCIIKILTNLQVLHNSGYILYLFAFLLIVYTVEFSFFKYAFKTLILTLRLNQVTIFSDKLELVALISPEDADYLRANCVVSGLDFNSSKMMTLKTLSTVSELDSLCKYFSIAEIQT